MEPLESDSAMRFEEVLEAYHDEIFRYLYRLCLVGGGSQPRALAQDLTQDTFERAFSAYPRLRPNSNLRAWLYKIAGNRARDQYAKQKRAENSVLELSRLPAPPEPPERLLQQRERRQWLLREIHLLPYKQQQALILRYLQDLEYAAIGQILSCSNESARANVYQGLKALRAAAKSKEEQA